jgi:hypothetical protein
MLELPAKLMEPARIAFHVDGRIPGYRRKLVLLKVMEVAVRGSGPEAILEVTKAEA